MSTEAIAVETKPRRGSQGWRMFVHQLRGEQLVFWRSKEAALFIFLFPLLLFLLLGSVYSGKIYGVPASQALLAGLIGYGCANTAFAGLAIQLVVRREAAILKRLRATPLPASTYVAALLVSTLLVFALQTVALFLMGSVLYSTPFPSDVASLAAAVVIGAAAFAALGVATSTFIRSAEGSSAVVNFILLPMAFLSGAFGPTLHYGAFLRAIGDVLPLKYFIDIAATSAHRRDAILDQAADLAASPRWGSGWAPPPRYLPTFRSGADRLRARATASMPMRISQVYVPRPANRRAQRRDEILDVLVGDDERWQHLQHGHVVPGHLDQNPVVAEERRDDELGEEPVLEPIDESVGARHRAGVGKLDRPQQTEAAHLPHHVVSARTSGLGELEEPRSPILPPSARRDPARRARPASRARPPSRARWARTSSRG